eukprot:5648666-Alexandrium_andersonii.AAC.1
MSASLVGSEMCIRDRASPEARRWCSPRRIRRARSSARLPRSPHPRPRLSCLLYTSDAADDM